MSEPAEDQDEVTAALAVLRHGSSEATDRLLPLVYGELRRIAHRQLSAERAGHTLSTTALVHEAYLRLMKQRAKSWPDRSQFLAIAARTMRRILVDYARRHWSIRRGGTNQRAVALEDVDDAGALAVAERADELLALDEALDRLAVLDPRLASVVECRFFGGLSETETADALGISQRTVSRDWLTAKGWLFKELRDGSA